MAGKHRRAENTRVRAFPGRIRRGILLFAAVILLMGTVGSSLAFLSTGTEEKENTFQTAKLSCRVNENYVFPNKEKVNVENTCAYPVFVRVKLLPYWYDKDKDVVVANTAWTPDFQPGEGWVKNGGKSANKAKARPQGWAFAKGILMKERENLTGQSFGRWTVLGECTLDEGQRRR